MNTGSDEASSVLPNILSHYGNDIDDNCLLLHLSMLSDLCDRTAPRISHADINNVFQVLNNDAWTQMLQEVVNLLRLYLTLPVNSCTADRCFSGLSRLKTYLRSTITRKILNHIAVLHFRREQSVDFNEICNLFILRNEMRQATFVVFPN
jgi:hypothetical protein